MKQKMEAAVLYAPGDLRFEMADAPQPPSDNEVLIKVMAVGICGSDTDRIMHTGTYSFPMIPGHEFCGEIAAQGSGVTGFAAGDRVLVAPLMPCFTCESCQGGHFGQCDSYDFLGSRRNGAFAEYVLAPAQNLIKLPDEVSFEEGAVVEPAAVTLHGMLKLGVIAGECVVVLGCGALGLSALQFAKIMGATKAIAVDISDKALELAKTCGADVCVNSGSEDAYSAVMELTGGRGAGAVVETAGSPITQELCVRMAKKLGRVLYLGTAHRDVVLPPETFENIIRNELLLMGAWNSYSAPFPGVEWTACVEYMRTGQLKTLPLITHKIPLKELPEIIKRMDERSFPYTKVIVDLQK